MLYETFDATKLELLAQADRLRRSSAGQAVAKALAPQQRPAAIERVAQSKPAKFIDRTIRGIKEVVRDLPVISLPADTIRHTHCVDLHVASIGDEPENPLRYIQLGEALHAVRQEQVVLKVVRSFDPSAALTMVAARLLAELSRQGPPRQDFGALIGKAYSLLRRVNEWSFDEHYVAARMYRLASRPNRAVTHARTAADLAFAAKNALPLDAPVPVWRRALGALRLRYSGDLEVLDPPAALAKAEGAAMTAMAWALLDDGEVDMARQAARRAIAIRYTGGHELLAAAVDLGDGTVRQRVKHRYELLLRHQLGDRRHYRGHWRGVAGVAASVTAVQGRKVKRTRDRILGRKPESEPASTDLPG